MSSTFDPRLFDHVSLWEQYGLAYTNFWRMDTVLEPPWLTFGHCSRVGAVELNIDAPKMVPVRDSEASKGMGHLHRRSFAGLVPSSRSPRSQPEVEATA